MRVLPPALAGKLDEGVTTLASAWRLTRGDGLVVAFTQHDRDLTFDGSIFIAAHSFVGRDDEKELSLAPDRTALSGALTIGAISKADLELGRWDRAKVEAFLVDWSNPADFIPMWQGIIGGASWRGVAFELDIVGPETVLNREIGRVYARTCDATLGDARCQVNLVDFGRTLTASVATAVSDRSLIIASPIGKTAADFIGGVVKILDGPAANWRCDIARIETLATGWQIYFSRPFPISPLVNNALTLSMGCDKSFATCTARFSNSLNFRGQPTLPGDDVAFGGPAVTGNDGGKR